MSDELTRLQASLPRYTFERVLARGGMGVVYLARERHPDRHVAIKVLYPELAGRLGRDRFLREISVASGLTHPLIVSIFAAGEADGILYYVMPYVEGETLAERLARVGRLEPTEAFRYALDIAGALQYAHDRQIIHRDIKPGNILLHQGHALLADFGVARAVEAAESDAITETGIAIGTPAYMSPEQISADSPVDGRADLYSLGCVLYEMLIGQSPFAGGVTRRVLHRHLLEPVPSVRAARDDLPPAVGAIVARLLEKDPDRRFQSAQEFRDAVRGEGSLRSAWSISLDRIRPTVARRRVVGGGVLAAAAIVAALLAGRRWQAVSDDATDALLAGAWRESLAIMPARVRSSDERFLHAGDGLPNLISGDIARVPWVKVISGNTTAAWLDSALTSRQLASRLGVRLLVLLSVTPVDEQRARIAVEIADGPADRRRWGNEWTVHADSLVEAEPLIAEEVIRRLFREVGADDMEPTLRRTAGPEHELYLRGKRALARRTPDGLREAIQWYGAALEANPRYAIALADLSSAYALSITYRYRLEVDPYTAARRAFTFADRAVELDPDLAAGFAARGYIAAIAGGPEELVRSDFARARLLQPNNANVPSWTARVLAQSGRLAQAVREARRAVELEPTSASRRIALAGWLLQQESYAEAVEQAERAIALEPSLALPRSILGLALFLDGKRTRCTNSDLGPHEVLHAMCLHDRGQVDSAASIVARIEAALQRGELPDSAFAETLWLEDLAVWWAWRGDAERAAHWLARTYESSPSGVQSWVLNSPVFDAVRGSAPVQAVIFRARRDPWTRVRSEAIAGPGGTGVGADSGSNHVRPPGAVVAVLSTSPRGLRASRDPPHRAGRPTVSSSGRVGQAPRGRPSSSS